MGRHLSTNQCAHLLGGRTSYCKLKYLISVLRNLHGYARRPFKTTKIKRYYTSFSSDHRFRNGVREVEYLQAVPFCSSSDRDVLKVKAPVGLFQDTQTTSQLYVLGARLGESFNRLSRHINVYFKPKDVPLAPVAGNPNFLLTTPEPCSKLQRRSQRAARETRVFQDQDTTHTPKSGAKKNISETQPEPETRPRLQLFHISSLATRFGESYSYVANHINSVFSGRPAINFQIQDTVEDLSSAGGSSRRQRRRKMQKEQNKISVEADKPTQSAAVEDNTFNKRVEGYLLIATHINRYFGAKVADTADCGRIHKEKIVGENGSTYQKESSERSASETQRALSQQEQEEHPIPRTQGLFHTSSNTAHFGESYFETANHINRYFQSASAEDVDMNPVRGMETETAATKRLKAVSFMDRLMHPSTSIPYLLGSYLKLEPWAQSGRSKPDAAAPETAFMRRASQVLNRRQADDMTYELICNLRQALSPDALTACVEALNEHLIRYPSCREIMWQEKTAVKLLKQRRRHRDNDGLQSAIRETLALIGYVDPVKGHGIRVLSIDGGGTRGVVPLQVLKLLEAETGKQIHQLFDYICGVSTGAVLAFMLGLARFSLEECADMYRRFGSDVFRQNPLVGTVKMGWSHSYYNTETWETILREKMGEKVLIRTSRDELSPKVSAVSAVVNWGNSPKAFVFRNYNHTPGSLSRYAGGSGYEMWQAVRASSAAPGYFQEFPLQSDIHQDGGIILNNPCALAVHESRLLWPNQHFQCVLSLGTGRYDNVKRGPATSTTLRAKISNLISSATDTEGVHTLLDDLLAPDVYFRFNPMLSAEVSLDESRPGALDQLKKDTQVYLERNRLKLARLCLVLGPERSAMSHTKDWLSERAWEVKQRWV